MPLGAIYNYLTVIEIGRFKIFKDRGKVFIRPTVMAKCKCGNIIEVTETALRNSHTKSCGCFVGEKCRSRNIDNSTHRMTGTRTYKSWDTMKQRCFNLNFNCFHRYGGRGITICTRWLESFENFHADMGDRPEGMSLDRIDNNGNYEPENCRWSTAKEQANNRASNQKVTLNSQQYSVSALSELLKIDKSNIPKYAKKHSITYQEAADIYIKKYADRLTADSADLKD